jgi:hypothetical protein
MEFQNPKYSMSSYVPFAIVILDYKTSPVFSSCFILTNFMMFFPAHAHRCTVGKLGRREVGGGRGVTNKLSEKFYIMYIFADQDILHIHRIPTFLWDHIYIGRPTLYTVCIASGSQQYSNDIGQF